MNTRWLSLASCLLLAAGPALHSRGETRNTVRNGSFEKLAAPDSAPEGWSTSGDAAIRQRLTSDTGRDGRRCAKFECTHFEGSSPSAHAMLCQVGAVGVARGQWYRLSFWAKAEGIARRAVEVALSDTRVWANAGLSDAFVASPQWERFEMLFRARTDLPAAASRLQFWFKSAGTLWLDDVELVETENLQQWYPQLPTEGVKNLIPNSSFECGGANWGSYTYGLSGWAGNLYRLEGETEPAAAWHGRHSMKIALTPQTLPVFWFDYYEPVRQPVRRVLIANRGWFRVKPGEKLTLSAYLRADAESTAAQLLAIEAPDRTQRRDVAVGTEWKRYEFAFTASQPFLFIALGLDLEASKRDAGTLWLDAVQLERAERANAYEPRRPLESFVETGVTGNIFTAPKDGATLTLRAFNDSAQEQSAGGRLAVSDFFDRPMPAGQPALRVPAHSAASATIRGVAAGRLGFFRAEWTTGAETQSLRGAVIEPAAKGLPDSPLGFNHAYPWQFLNVLAREAGLVWWRDWSAKWQTVEPRQGQFDWSVADAQIDRVRELDGNVEVLLPFPSALWSTTARAAEVAKAAGNNSYLRSRLPVAYMPKSLEDFGAYAAQTARHYRDGRPRSPTHFQILNEPVYTDYALPRKFGYSVDDYVRLLGTASRAIHAADPAARVVGGLSANLDSGYTREFVEKGGLRFLDVFDLHLYDAPSPGETYEDSFRELEELMRAHGGPKPVWITEWGCYADDDPPSIPQSVGDDTMNRCKWRSERAATEHIVKFTAVAFAHGVRKIFFHAGTCGTINGSDAGGVLFEYGGAPRKMYPGVAALTKLLGVPDESVQAPHRDDLHAYVFRTGPRAVAVVWAAAGRTATLKPGEDVRARDIMGNELPAGDVGLGETPVYLLGATGEAILKAIR